MSKTSVGSNPGPATISNCFSMPLLGHVRNSKVSVASEPERTQRLTDLQSSDRGDIPVKSGARSIRNHRGTVADFEWVLQDGVGPVDIFKPVRRRRRCQQMRTDLGGEGATT